MNGDQPVPPRFVGVPAPAVSRIMRTSTVIGVVVGVLSVAALPAMVAFPYLVVPDGEELRIWLPLMGVIAVAGAVAATVGALSARSWVQSGYLNLDKVQATRSLLRAACTITTLGAAATCGVYLRIVTAADGAVPLSWAYVAALVVATLLPYLTLFALRP